MNCDNQASWVVTIFLGQQLAGLYSNLRVSCAVQRQTLTTRACSKPTATQGGALRVLHGGRETRVDLAARNAKSSCFAAFYSGNLPE